MALMLVPSSATKLWQALSGSNIGMLLRRLWPFLLPATVTDGWAQASRTVAFALARSELCLYCYSMPLQA